MTQSNDTPKPTARQRYCVANRFGDVPDDVFEEAQRRNSAPRTITQSFFGDPPAGFSALDRKRCGDGEKPNSLARATDPSPRWQAMPIMLSSAPDGEGSHD
ncbi:hypothetical protein ACRQ5Q_42870 (plasmid) [Bradyrhizobium sp. PMVTL-01]|uniref:hypothetical protein n=1 Tax=Bradyrhizobium sp. PMVTL-01 TaxID=3434999 RepID=UPI003F71541E